MLKPSTIDENLMYSSVMIKTQAGYGTGSVFESDGILILVTNKHVVNFHEHESVTLTFHLTDNQGNPSDDMVEITGMFRWFFHETLDLCCCLLNHVGNALRKTLNRTLFLRSYSEQNIISNNDLLSSLSMIETVIMVGYPIGLVDKTNEFPVFRKGITASHAGLNFQEKGVGLVDISCWPGSSGSPIMIYDEGSYIDKKQHALLPGNRLYLLGYLFAGPMYNAIGTLSKVNIPLNLPNNMPNSYVPMNLGYYVFASELMSMIPHIKQVVDSIQHDTKILAEWDINTVFNYSLINVSNKDTQ